jgi:glycosyltransferase involved in cell wall biosynthesis
MRVLYLGANLRMQIASHSGFAIRARELLTALEELGVETIPFAAGDQTDNVRAQTVYRRTLSRFLPRTVTAAMRDLYEIWNDEKFYRLAETRLQRTHPDAIVQQDDRYSRAGVKLGRKYRLPVFLDDVVPIWESEQYSKRSFKSLARFMRRRAFSQADGLIAVSWGMVKQLRSEGIPEGKIHLIPNGVDCQRFSPDVDAGGIKDKYALKGKIVVGYAGGFMPWHALDLLIRAAVGVTRAEPCVHFLLLGDSEIRPQLEALTQQLGVEEHFTFPGLVPHPEVPSYLGAMDITVLPATLEYMSPIKIFEYMAMKKPVIAPKGNYTIEELVIPDQTGLLFQAGNEQDLSHTITLLAKDADLRQRMGHECRTFVLNNHTWRHQGAKLIEAMQQALANDREIK